MKKLGYWTIVLASLLTNVAFADWHHVEPVIQYLSNRPLFAGGDTTHVYYDLGDENDTIEIIRVLPSITEGTLDDWELNTEWAQSELIRQLKDSLSLSSENLISTVLNPSEMDLSTYLSGIEDFRHVIIMGDWETLLPTIPEDEIPSRYLYRASPADWAGDVGNEAYFIVADSVLENNAEINVWLIAETKRAMNYAVSSLCQSMLETSTQYNPTVEKIVALDYPNFERRYVGENEDLTRIQGTHYTDARAHAKAIVKNSRELLLECKGNGIMQFGDASYYDDEFTSSYLEYDNHRHERIDNVLKLIQDKNAAGWGGEALGYGWRDFGFDWIAGTGYEWKRFGEDESKWEWASIEIEKKCTLEHESGDTYKLVPIQSDSVRNGDFNLWDGDIPRFWQSLKIDSTSGGEWTRGLESGNTYASKTIDAGQNSGLVQTVHVDSALGIPGKHLFIEFDVKLGSSSDMTIYFKHMAHPTLNGVDFNDESSYGFDNYHHKLYPGQKTFSSGELSDWTTVRFEFYTYGFMYDSLGIFFKPSSTVTVNIDNVKVHDTPFYHVYLVDTCSEAIIDLYENDSFDNELSGCGSNVLLSDANAPTGDGNLGIYKTANFKCVYNGINPEDIEDWYAVIRYHAFIRREIGPLYVESIADPPAKYYGNRDASRAEYVTGIVKEHMDWFQDRVTETNSSGSEVCENGLQINGYFCRHNEEWGQGYSRYSVNLAKNLCSAPDSTTSLCGVWARYHAMLFDSLQPSEGPEMPLFVYADMYSSIHNGKRFMRMNNPFDLRGFDESPVYGDTTHLDNDLSDQIGYNQDVIMVDWYLHDQLASGNYLENAQLFIDEWWDLVEPFAHTHDLQVLYGLLWNPDITFQDRLTDFQTLAFLTDLVNDCYNYPPSGAAFGRGFAGGLLVEEHAQLGDTSSPYTNSEFFDNWQMYRDNDEFIKMWWNFGPIVFPERDLPVACSFGNSSVHGEWEVLPVPYPEDHDWTINEVVFEYKMYTQKNVTGPTKIYLSQNPSTKFWELDLNLPTGGGYVEYRMYADDTFDNVTCLPPRGSDPDDFSKGDKEYLTFERRLTTDISDTLVIWAPGILTQKLGIVNDGLVIVRPLPGYKRATLYLTDEAQINLSTPGTGYIGWNAKPRIIFEGTDSTRIHIKGISDTTRWGGINLDSLGSVDMQYVTFDKNTFSSIQGNALSSDSVIFLNETEFLDPLTIEGDLSIGGNGVFAGIEIADSAHLTIIVGSEFTFLDGTSIQLGDMSGLSVEGNDTMSVTLRAEVDSLPWTGIINDQGNGTVELSYCKIENASAGVLCDGYGNTVDAEFSEFVDCGAGLLAVNGGSVSACECYFHENGTGIQLANLASAEVIDSEISSNDGSGISAFSRSLVQLEDCEIASNQGDGLAGGVGLFTGSVALMQCTEIEDNEGPGISAYGGSLILTSVDEVSSPLRNWRGNKIANNQTGIIAGQLNLKGRVGLGLINGHNSITIDSLSDGYLISWDDKQGYDIWSDVYWGMTDTTEILDLLPNYTTLSSIDSSWSSCPSFVPDTTIHDSLVNIFLDPMTNEFEDSLSTAYNQYYDILDNQEKSDYAFSASDRLLALNMSGQLTYDSTITRLTTIADSTSDLDLKSWLMNTIAWCWAELDSMSLAGAIYDSLTQNGDTYFQRASSEVQEAMLLVHSIDTDTTVESKPESIMAYIDSARSCLYDLCVWDQYVITDSVVMYAPMRVDTTITIEQGGVLTILPHPGVENPVVRFTYLFDMQQQLIKFGNIKVCGTDTTLTKGKLYILGTPDNNVHLEWDDQSYAFESGISSNGIVKLAHTEFEGLDFLSLQAGCQLPDWHLPILEVDSCIFRNFDEGLNLQWMDTTSYIRNCTFESVGSPSSPMGYTYAPCIAVYATDEFEISNCNFVGNEGVSVYIRESTDIYVNNCDITSGSYYDLFVWSGDMSVECCSITSDGDTLPEIGVYTGTMDLTGAHTTIADSSGPLIFTEDPSYVDLEDGENLFELYSGIGYYLESGDTTQTWDITWNTWEPYAPDDPDFYNHLYPSNPAKWTVDSSLADFLACGESAQSDIGGSNWMITPLPYHEAGTSSIDSEEGETSTQYKSRVSKYDGKDASKKSIKGPVSKKATDVSKRKTEHQYSRKQTASKTKLLTKLDQSVQHHHQLAEWREVKSLSKHGDKFASLTAAKQFISEYPDSKLAPAAITKLSTLSRQLGTEGSVSKFLLEKSETLPNAKDRLLARRLGTKAKAYEGEPKEALMQLESMMATSETLKDSIFALVDAMQVYYDFHQREELMPRFNNVRIESLPEMVKRTLYLARVMDDPNLVPDKEPVAVPKEYKLYQNYPNPFNPSTEIKFDLPETVPVKMMVYNILGQHVVTLIDEVRAAGTIAIPWDGKNTHGLDVATGMYIYQIKAGSFTDAKKMLLLK